MLNLQQSTVKYYSVSAFMIQYMLCSITFMYRYMLTYGINLCDANFCLLRFLRAQPNFAWPH